MKKDSVLKEFNQMSHGMQKCTDNRKKCSGCKELETLKTRQLFGAWTTSIADLKPITVKEIVQDLYRRARNNQRLLKDHRSLLCRWYEGRVLVGQLCVDPTRKGIAVLTVIEADDGTTCIVHVFNATPTTSRQEELRRMYPKGVKVAITRPCIGCVHPMFSPVVLYVQSPANMDFVGISRDSLGRLAPNELRSEGNKQFTQGNYILAIQYYTECYSSIDIKTRDMEMKKEYVLAISNRAEAWLKLNMYEKAIADANLAIEIDPLHAKSLFRKGRALMSLHEHVDARGSLRLAGKHADGESKKDIMDALERCKIFLQQSQKGIYDVGEYVSGGCNVDLAPKCSDYIGPVEVRVTRDGRGRGLFVTRRVRLGELLLANNNVAFSGPVKRDTCTESDLFVEAFRACKSSRKTLHKLYALADEGVVPNMKLFKPNMGYEGIGDDYPIDIEKIQKAVKAGLFPWSILGQADRKCRVWTLPGFINHSCLPNVSKLEVGKATLIHAARNMHAGEEMLLSYVDPYVPWTERKKALMDDWGFECTCKRCCLEKANRGLLNDLPKFEDFVKENHDTIENHTKLLQKIESKLTQADRLTQEERDLIRVTLFDFYGPLSVGGKNTGNSKYNSLRKVITPEKFLKLLHCTAPGHPKTLVYMSYLARFREDTSDIYQQVLMDEFTAAYGAQCACLAWKVLKSYFEAALENLMEVSGIVEYRVCKFSCSEDDGFRFECLF